tara:strand:- start:69 stop:542 length:474 start_codon:yes stop_codon:yes gene_type:complete
MRKEVNTEYITDSDHLIGNRARRDIKEDILNLRNDGNSYKEIARLLNCSKGTISYHCQNEKLTDIGLGNNYKISDEIINEISEFTKKNPIKEAMAKFGLGRTFIIKHMSRKGILLSDDVKKGIYDYSKDHTTTETATHFGVSLGSVVKYRCENYFKK